MSDRQDREVAESLDATPDLLPFLAELLADVPELGGNVETIAAVLQAVELPAKATRVLDLGCGKGSVGIRLAQESGFNVKGVDLFEPFVREAKRRAVAANVEGLCRPRQNDVQFHTSVVSK